MSRCLLLLPLFAIYGNLWGVPGRTKGRLVYVGRPVGLHIVSGVGRPAVPVFGGVSIIDTFCVCKQVAVITFVLSSIQNVLGSVPNFPVIFKTRQAKYVYPTLRCVRVTIVAVEKQYYIF
jgi:hypothetical protein